jgi:hypothetical protein
VAPNYRQQQCTLSSSCLVSSIFDHSVRTYGYVLYPHQTWSCSVPSHTPWGLVLPCLVLKVAHSSLFAKGSALSSVTKLHLTARISPPQPRDGSAVMGMTPCSDQVPLWRRRRLRHFAIAKARPKPGWFSSRLWSP